MKRQKTAVVLVTVMMVLTGMAAVSAADLRVMHTQKTKDAVIVLKSESGQWSAGSNAFVLEFTSPTRQPLDVGKVTLSTSMTMPGMAPMIAGATVSPDKAPGRYLGTISFPDGGTRQVTVAWDGPAGKGSTRFSVPVR
jgi:hypothetical protein